MTSQKEMTMRIRRIATVLVTLAVAVGAWAFTSRATTPAAPVPLVRAVESVAITVGDMQGAVDFYTRVLRFEKISDATVEGDGHERRHAVPGARVRTVRLRLGQEHLDLVEYLSPRGR